jgi:hypothetical protein
MNNFASAIYRDLTCATAALLITLVLSLAFVQSTSAAPGQASTPSAAPCVHV